MDIEDIDQALNNAAIELKTARDYIAKAISMPDDEERYRLLDEAGGMLSDGAITMHSVEDDIAKELTRMDREM